MYVTHTMTTRNMQILMLLYFKLLVKNQKGFNGECGMVWTIEEIYTWYDPYSFLLTRNYSQLLYFLLTKKDITSNTWWCIIFKRVLSQKSFYPGLFTNWPWVLWMRFVSEISWPVMKSIAANDNRRVKQTMLCYFKHVAIFGDEHYPNRSIRDALHIWCFDITISWKRYVSYRIGSAYVISFK